MLASWTLNLRHLDGFVAIARLGSISAAAGELGLSQSAMTQAMGKLERRLGIMLLERGATGTALTDVGRSFASRAGRALAGLNESADHGSGARPLTRQATMAQLRAVAAVEQAGSTRRAAALIGMSQPSVHRAVSALGDALAVPLFLPSGKRHLPTATASRLARATRLALSELQAGIDEATGDARGRGRVVVGAMALVRAGLLPIALARLCRLHPDASGQVVEGAYPDLLNRLLGGEIDLILGALRGDAEAGVVEWRLWQDRLVVVGRADHPLAGVGGWPPVALARYPWIASPAGTPRRLRWEKLLRTAGVEPPEPRIEASSASAIRGLLLQGDWLAMLSPDQCRAEREGGRLAVIGGPSLASTRPIGVTMRAGWQPDAVQQSMLAILAQCAREQEAAG